MGREALREALDYGAAVDALERAFALGPEAYANPERETHAVPDGELMLMPASGHEGVGVKLVTLTPANPARDRPFIQGVYALFSPGEQTPEAIFDGAALTELRTAAVSGVATRRLARPGAERLVVFGAGVQAAAHVECLLAICPTIHSVGIVGRDPQRAAALVAALRGEGIEATQMTAEAVRTADIICTCTTAAEPLFPGEWVPAGAHVNAVGAYRTDRRELDAALLSSSTLIVEDRDAALHEAGDLVLAIAEGGLTAGDIDADLREVVAGLARRPDETAITVFKSVGLALEDLVIARAALSRDAQAPSSRPAQMPRV
jgi:ornithine cyclodeaminase/alanine dehydrogenase-like protein (mu-crystallin family)